MIAHTVSLSARNVIALKSPNFPTLNYASKISQPLVNMKPCVNSQTTLSYARFVYIVINIIFTLTFVVPVMGHSSIIKSICLTCGELFGFCRVFVQFAWPNLFYTLGLMLHAINLRRAWCFLQVYSFWRKWWVRFLIHDMIFVLCWQGLEVSFYLSMTHASPSM